MAWILLCKHCKFGEKIYYNSRDIEFFLGDYFFWRALYVCIYNAQLCTNRIWHILSMQKSKSKVSKPVTWNDIFSVIDWREVCSGWVNPKSQVTTCNRKQVVSPINSDSSPVGTPVSDSRLHLWFHVVVTSLWRIRWYSDSWTNPAADLSGSTRGKSPAYKWHQYHYKYYPVTAPASTQPCSPISKDICCYI